MKELTIKGYGFFNDKMEVLCIRRTDSGKNWNFKLIPWREAKADEVIIFWENDLRKYLEMIEYIPFYENVNSDMAKEFTKLEPIAVERIDDKIWIG